MLATAISKLATETVRKPRVGGEERVEQTGGKVERLNDSRGREMWKETETGGEVVPLALMSASPERKLHQCG